MLTYATRSALLLRPLIQSTRATARALSATPYLDRTQQGPVWPTLTKKPDEKTLEKDGKGVCAWLGSASSKPADLNPQLAARVYDLYLPVYYWCKDVVEKNPTKPTVIFMSAPQGCGKTTIMRMIAGFLAPSDGDIRIKGRSVLDVAPNKRPVNMVFQHLALFPMMNVADNIGYGLRRAGLPKAEITRKVGEVLDRIDMPEGTIVSGLESDGGTRFFCGGGNSGKVRAVRRPGKA